MRQVYAIAQRAGMDPKQFCRIRNGCFSDVVPEQPVSSFRGLMASTRISELLGVEPVAARDTLRRDTPTAKELQPTTALPSKRAWWYEVGDYLENPHRHFAAMDRLRQPMEWPEDVQNNNDSVLQ